ncbi:PepSY domain-containing protein [Streptococcus pacificus]|uniref:PepSY domain-containing protein n=1 Tax=Streptococcus pacificus TaxID=2740577 RepID=A0ABS0ZHZ8_9STRE|nr:PepSY domain-containing protein [Streptococcus pacificus]MBJ8325631.1 PepSY domain-containing protein [Streptococcus pacificus]
MKQLTKKSLMIGIIAIIVIAAGGYAIANELFDRDSPMEEKVETIFDDEADDVDDDHLESKNDTQKADPSPQTQTVKVDFNSAMKTALAEAKTGFVTDIELGFDNNQPHYEIEIADNNMQKSYIVDANSGQIISSKVENEDDYPISEPKQKITDVITLINKNYPEAQLKDISLDTDYPNQMVYEVTIITDNLEKELTLSADDATILSEKFDD